VHEILFENIRIDRPLGRPRPRREDNIKLDHIEKGCKNVKSI